MVINMIKKKKVFGHLNSLLKQNISGATTPIQTLASKNSNTLEQSCIKAILW